MESEGRERERQSNRMKVSKKITLLNYRVMGELKGRIAYTKASVERYEKKDIGRKSKSDDSE